MEFLKDGVQTVDINAPKIHSLSVANLEGVWGIRENLAVGPNYLWGNCRKIM